MTAFPPFISAVDALQARHFVFHASGFMPLAIENLENAWEGFPVYSMTHYYTQNGDMMNDPDMTFAVLHDARMIVPLTFQQDGAWWTDSGTVYEEVFPEPGKYVPMLMDDLDSFLATWTVNIVAQGFRPDEAKASAPEGTSAE